MRFLVDECLSPATASALRESDHDAIHVTDLGLAGRPDEEVMAAALADGRVIVSADTDFGELLARSNTALPSVVLFRGAQVAPLALAGLLLANLDRFEADLERGAIVVILDDRIRIRRLPIGSDGSNE
jgi:predicted nuclease of predicted toxin-antitoxin system